MTDGNAARVQKFSHQRFFESWDMGLAAALIFGQTIREVGNSTVLLAKPCYEFLHGHYGPSTSVTRVRD